MRRRSSLILRQVSPQACSAMRSSSSESTVRATCAWMRCGAQWNTGRSFSPPLSERQIGGAQGVVIAVHDELAVEALGCRDRGLIDVRDVVAGEAQVAAVAAGGAQVADPLAV